MTSLNRTCVVSTITVTNTAEIVTATANEPIDADRWLSMVLVDIFAKRVPMIVPMPISATPRSHGGRVPSTSPAPCSRLEPSIAPNIQLAGNFVRRSASALAMDAATRASSPAGEAITTAAA